MRRSGSLICDVKICEYIINPYKCVTTYCSPIIDAALSVADPVFLLLFGYLAADPYPIRILFTENVEFAVIFVHIPHHSLQLVHWTRFEYSIKKCRLFD